MMMATFILPPPGMKPDMVSNEGGQVTPHILPAQRSGLFVPVGRQGLAW